MFCLLPLIDNCIKKTIAQTSDSPIEAELSYPKCGDHQQGAREMIYMHHRYYSPLLGHFLTPDFRAPDIYDPTTFTEPYAYAAGNPFMYWDPNGLERAMGHAAAMDHVRRAGSWTDSETVKKAVQGIESERTVTDKEAAFATGIIKGAGATIVILSLPVSGTTLFIVGGTVAGISGIYHGIDRFQSGQSGGESFVGGIVDGTGINYAYATFTNEDLVTGANLGLSSVDLAERRGSFLGGVIVAPLSGGIRQLLTKQLPKGKVKNRYLAIELEQLLKNSSASSRTAIAKYILNGKLNQESQKTVFRFATMSNPSTMVSNLSKASQLTQLRVRFLLKFSPYRQWRAHRHMRGDTRNSPFISVIENPAALARSTDPWASTIVTGKPGINGVMRAPNLAQLSVPESLIYRPRPDNFLSIEETELIILSDDLLPYLFYWMNNPY